MKKLYKKYARGNSIDLDEVLAYQLPNPVWLEKKRQEDEQLRLKSSSPKDFKEYIRKRLHN